MSKKKKNYNDGVERDEEDLSEYAKIGRDAAAGVVARMDEIMAEAKETSMAKTKESVGKTRRTGVLSLLIGIFLIIGGVVSLDAGIGIYLLISGALILLFGICMFSIASSNKKLVADYESGKDVTVTDYQSSKDVTAQQDEIVARAKVTVMEKTKAGNAKQIAGVITFLIGFFLIFAAFALFIKVEFGAYLLGGGVLLLIIGIILLIMARSEKKN